MPTECKKLGGGGEIKRDGTKEDGKIIIMSGQIWILSVYNIR